MTTLFEGLERGDLKRLVHTELHIDEFKSKLGDDKDMVVVSFKVAGKEPAQDLVNFIEKGYDWVVDADVSSGEMDDGDYIVFVECERNSEIAKNIVQLLDDVMSTTEQKAGDWRVRYYKDREDHKLDLETLTKLIPNSPESYNAKFGKEDDEQEDDKSDKDLDNIRAAAGIKIKTKAPKNELTDSIRRAAGIL